VKEATKAPVAVNAGDAGRLPFNPDRLLEDGDTVQVGQVSLRVIHTPGHTPGSICLFSDGYLLSGDTLFPNGPGKTATPQNFRQVVDSIVSKLFILPDDTQVYSGHGDITALGREKGRFNAFSRGPQNPNLCGDVLWVQES
ncbi:MAG: MBL fold metallo-hydrolase, partial [Dehalococcoidia bacterium]|jgi:glyoxylase-like metal-dependent hydrolase (beta-lactamase superfamily II)|nr:MBL fold metallo-hydrolase [Dehalococcoidia bacterium]